jgi:hypothetical protein
LLRVSKVGALLPRIPIRIRIRIQRQINIDMIVQPIKAITLSGDFCGAAPLIRGAKGGALGD